jgi:hypothetical protein
MAGVDVVVDVVDIKMLIFKVVVDVTDGGDIGGGVVVLDVVGGEPRAAVANDDVAIGDVQVALAALRTAGGEFGEFAFGSRKMQLLGAGGGDGRGSE